MHFQQTVVHETSADVSKKGLQKETLFHLNKKRLYSWEGVSEKAPILIKPVRNVNEHIALWGTYSIAKPNFLTIMSDFAEDFKKRIQEWTQSSDTFPRRSKTGRENLPLLRTILTFLVGGLATAAGNDIAEEIIGQNGYRDELVALLFGSAGAHFTLGFTKRLCADRPTLTSGLWTSTAAGGSLGLGIASLTAAPLVSMLDGGIIAGSFLIPAGIHMIRNRTGGKKKCEFCKKKQKCTNAVCRNCLRIIFPAPAVDCDKKFFLNWYEVASILQEQDLNYLESLELVMKHWSLPLNKRMVDCQEFYLWIKNHSELLHKYRDTIESSPDTDRKLKSFGL